MTDGFKYNFRDEEGTDAEHELDMAGLAAMVAWSDLRGGHDESALRFAVMAYRHIEFALRRLAEPGEVKRIRDKMEGECES